MAHKEPSETTPYFLLVAIVLSGISTFMLFPLLLFRLLEVGMTVAEVGLVLGFLSGTGRLLSFALGAANNFLGSKIVVCVGLICRIVGISVFAFDTNLAVYLACAAFASVGASGAALGIKTELMRVAATRKLITLRSMAINSGAIVGPALGAGLYHFFSFRIILGISMLIYVLLLIVMVFLHFAPPEAASTNSIEEPKGASKYRDYVLISVVAALYWAIYSQWSLVIPLIAEQAFGEEEFSNVLYICNALIVLALQYPLLVVLLKPITDRAILVVGFSVFLGAFACLFPHPSSVIALLFCAIFSVGELLVSPTLDSQTAQLAPATLGLTRAYGFQDTFSGLFAIGGASLGGWLIEQHQGVVGSAYLGIPAAVLAVAMVALVRNKKVPGQRGG